MRRPRTRFVAQFIGLGHFLRGEIHDACITTELGEVPYTSALSLTGNGRQVDLLVRPEHVHLCNTPHGTPVQVVHASFRGTRQLYTLRLPSGATFCALFPSEVTLRSGEDRPGDLAAQELWWCFHNKIRQRYRLTKHHLCILDRPRATTIAHDLAAQEDMMRSTTRRGYFWTRRITYLSIGGLLFLGGYLTALGPRCRRRY